MPTGHECWDKRIVTPICPGTSHHGVSTKSQLHSASRDLTAGLCVKPPSVSCSCQTLACSSPWREEGEEQLSRKEAPWWAWNEGREVCSETGPRGTLKNFVIQQTLWADARQLSILRSLSVAGLRGGSAPQETVSTEWKLPMAGHDHQQWPLFRLRANSLPAAHNWLESPRRKSSSSIWAEQEWARPLLNSFPYVTLEPSLEDNVSTICGHEEIHVHKLMRLLLPANDLTAIFYRYYPKERLLPLPWLQNGCSQSLALNLSPKFSPPERKTGWNSFTAEKPKRHSWKAFPALTDTCSEQARGLGFCG